MIGNVVLGGGNDGNALSLRHDKFDGEWHHIVVTYDSDSGVMALLGDGHQIVQERALRAFPIRLATFCIGETRPECRYQWSTPFPKGQLTGFKLFSRLLSLEEARGIYDRGDGRSYL